MTDTFAVFSSRFLLFGLLKNYFLEKKNPFQEGVERDEALEQNHNQPLLAKELA
jgi:hypothetical protein